MKAGVLTIAMLAAATASGAPRALRTRAAVTAPNATAGPLNVTVTPAALSFALADPDTSPKVSANSPATVSFSANGNAHKSWDLSIQVAGSLFFVGCPTVPIGAVTVTCTSVADNTGGGGGTCAAPLALSSAPQTVVVGRAGTGSNYYQVNLNLSLADSWRYIASLNPLCLLSVNYTATLR